MTDTKITDLAASTLAPLTAEFPANESASDKKWTGAQMRGVQDRVTTQVTFSNDATEQTIYSYSVPANLLGSTRMLRLTMFGTYLNNSGAGRTIELKLKYGATTLFDDVTGSLVQNAAARVWQMSVNLVNKGATNAQLINGQWFISAATNTSAGSGDLGGAANAGIGTPLQGTASEDSTASKTLAVTVQLSANTSTQTFTMDYAVLELL